MSGTIKSTTLFVANLGWITGAKELTTYFQSFGKVLKSRVIYSAKGISKGYGFVTFADTKAIDATLLHFSHSIDRRPIKIQCRMK